jgi:uroporphyrinogen decarboxylase
MNGQLLKNDLLIRALLRQDVERTPVWIMRQAGRYLPEYRQVRAQAGDFMTLCKTPELACEVTMQPLRRFDLDAAILFSDILTIPDAMGLELGFVQDAGPVFNKPVKTKQDIQNLSIPSPYSELNYVMQAVATIKAELNNTIPLIGFAGSPWTLATYMVEGSSSKTFSKVKALAYQDPETMDILLSKLAKAVEVYLIGQIESGVNACMIFDTWGGVLDPQSYRKFSLQYMQQIVHAINIYTKSKNLTVPIILFTKQGGQWLEYIADTGCHAVGIDWTVDIQSARERVGNKVALQGNLDPAVLYSSPQVIRQHVAKIIRDFGNHNGHVFNLGHGITPDVNPEHVTALVAAVKEFSTRN